MTSGTIKKLLTDRGFGFISTVSRGDIFFHATQLQDVDFASLRVGQEVEFEVGQDQSGRLRAEKVRVSQRKEAR